MDRLAGTLADQGASGGGKLQVEIWWGDEDGIEWLNKLFASKADVVDLAVHHVKDGNHNDLYVLQPLDDPEGGFD
jgi:hypothetical protein